jgi:hypothetical protein
MTVLYIFILYLIYIQHNVDVSLENYKEPLFRPRSESRFYEPYLQNLWVQMVRSKFRCIEINSENIIIILVLSHQGLWSDVVFVSLPFCCSVQKWQLK